MKTFIKHLKDQTPLSQHPYFEALSSCTMTKEQFIKSQLDFFQAVIFFTRPMLQLSARLNQYKQRWPILENVIEEHGDGCLNHTHGAQFKLLLNNLGISAEKLHIHQPHPSVEIFNLTLSAISTTKPTAFAIAVLGIIEDRFSDISAHIATALLTNQWLSKENLCHYALHKELDISHANDFYQLIQSEWNTPKGYVTIKKGLELGNYLFLNLYHQFWTVYIKAQNI